MPGMLLSNSLYRYQTRLSFFLFVCVRFFPNLHISIFLYQHCDLPTQKGFPGLEFIGLKSCYFGDSSSSTIIGYKEKSMRNEPKQLYIIWQFQSKAVSLAFLPMRHFPTFFLNYHLFSTMSHSHYLHFMHFPCMTFWCSVIHAWNTKVFYCIQHSLLLTDVGLSGLCMNLVLSC